MKLFKVATEQADTALLTGSIIFLSSNNKLAGIFDLENDQFLCKKDGRYFVDQIHYDSQFGAYVDCRHERRALHLNELDAMYLIKEESDKWPDGVQPTVSS